jgi:hypothetical protein
MKLAGKRQSTSPRPLRNTSLSFIANSLDSPARPVWRWISVFHHREMRVAVFYPFLYDDKGQVPEQNSLVHRVASFVGSIGSDQLVPGPLLDTGEFNDVHELLTLVGLKFEEMKQIRLNDGNARNFGSVGFDTVLSITPEIVFALSVRPKRN